MKKVIFAILGVLIGLISLSLIVEITELLIVKSITSKSISDFQANQELYFSVRNENWFLALKVFYTAVASIIAGVLCVSIAKSTREISLIILSVLQTASLIYGMLFSELKNTTPLYFWLILCVEVPLLIYLSGKAWIKIKSRAPSTTN